MDCSGNGVLAIGRGCAVDLWKDPLGSGGLLETPISFNNRRYMTHRFDDAAAGAGSTRISSLKFQPFEDILSVGHSHGIRNLIIPGSGIASPDMYEENPYATTKEKARRLVTRLLDKLQPDTIMLDPTKFGRMS